MSADGVEEITITFPKEDHQKHVEEEEDHQGHVEEESYTRVTDTLDTEKEYKIKVRPYMTKKSDGDFNFMLKQNNDEPMPYRIMSGKVLHETKGMYKMRLHGDIYKDSSICIACGRKLTHEVSKYFGIGPECGGHAYNNPFESKLKLKSAIAQMQNHLQSIVWEGFVIKSAIMECEELEHEEI
ncbi:unnamed protein product [marine sediment metagenome]|uniref:Uncharacterized protein n=1 Tax=marine sediment metagenome TaxID=412755 RepID=X0V0W8_9ZZZZ